jgi:hypothetical protein
MLRRPCYGPSANGWRRDGGIEMRDTQLSFDDLARRDLAPGWIPQEVERLRLRVAYLQGAYEDAEAEQTRLRADNARLRGEVAQLRAELTQTQQALRTAELRTLILHAQEALPRAQPAAVYRQLVALCHGDKWGQGQPAEALAHELMVLLNAMRDDGRLT